jgi:prevent-host-death family protein
MKTVAATELKAKLAEFLGDVERGEVINVTRHGKTIARLSPPEDHDEARRRHEAVEAIKAWKRTGRRTGITVEEILSARDEGRK